MIRVKFYHSDEGIQAYEVTGHAGYAESGSDIVCAAVSSQVISIENSLHQLVGITPQTQVDEVEGGYLKVSLPEEMDLETRSQAHFLMAHLAFTMEVMAENYPDYITIQYLSI